MGGKNGCKSTSGCKIEIDYLEVFFYPIIILGVSFCIKCENSPYGGDIMKKILSAFFMVTMLFATASCTTNTDPTTTAEPIINEQFGIEFYSYPSVEVLFTETDNNQITLEIYQSYDLYFRIEDHKFIDGIEEKVSISYPEEKFDLLFISTYSFSKSIVYRIYAMELFDQEEIRIMYESEEYIIQVQSVDYNFTQRACKKPDTDTLEKEFSTFQDMINSIQYHAFTSPFPGKDPNGFYYDSHVVYEKYNVYKRDFNENYDTSYQHYLIDNIYYPSQFDLAFPNIASREMTMLYQDENQVLPEAERSTMIEFSICVTNIDPDCTLPTKPVLSFTAIPLQYECDDSFIQQRIMQKLHSPYYLLKDRYSNQYLSYEVGTIALKIIQLGDDHIQAFFEDGSYAYFLSCSYDYR